MTAPGQRSSNAERSGIRHLSFTVGDESVWYRDLPGIEDTIKRLRIPDEERLWGWGYCRRSSRAYPEHILHGFSELMVYLSAERLPVDAAVICGPCQNSTATFVAAVRGMILPRLELSTGDVTVVEGADCVNIIHGIHEARRLLSAGHENVVVLAAEKVADESRRFRKHSLFSDFCLSLVVSRDTAGCRYEVLDTLIRPDPAPAEDTSGILVRRLEQESLADLLAASGFSRADLQRFFYINLFQPIARQKAKELGLGDRLWTEGTSRIGHCYGADPLIALDSFTRDAASCGGTHLLGASSRAFAGMCIVRAC